MWVLGPSKGIQSASNRQTGCPCHQRKADANTMPLPGLARYQQELTSRSLNLSYELLLLSGTWASLTGLHVLHLNSKRMNRTAFSMRRCLWKCRQKRWKVVWWITTELCRELHTAVKKISYHRTFLTSDTLEEKQVWIDFGYLQCYRKFSQLSLN